jgi:hypothetical protein
VDFHALWNTPARQPTQDLFTALPACRGSALQILSLPPNNHHHAAPVHLQMPGSVEGHTGVEAEETGDDSFLTTAGHRCTDKQGENP